MFGKNVSDLVCGMDVSERNFRKLESIKEPIEVDTVSSTDMSHRRGTPLQRNFYDGFVVFADREFELLCVLADGGSNFLLVCQQRGTIPPGFGREALE